MHGYIISHGGELNENDNFNMWKFFFLRIGRSDLTKKLEKVGPFECDELEKHCRVSAKCYPTIVPALYTMTKEKFKKSSMLPEITD